MAFVGQMSGDSMGKPGVMFYFNLRPCIKRLSIEEKGQLFEAILDYGELGVVPDVDGALGVAWDFVQQHIDFDSAQYDRKVLQKRYAVFVREIKKSGGTPVSFEEWLATTDIEKEQVVSPDSERYPRSNTNSDTNTNSISNIVGGGKRPPRPRFVPPTVKDVVAYCKEKELSVDAQRFVDYYQSNGWRVGKNPMKDWQAAVRSWNRKEKSENGETGHKPAWTIGTTV